MEGVTINDSKDLKVLTGPLGNLNELQCNIATPTLLAAIHSDGKDLLERMLIIDPQERLRSLFSLKRIAMYKDFDFDAVKSKRVFIEFYASGTGMYTFQILFFSTHIRIIDIANGS